jgi:aminopeptidase N
MTLQTLRSQVGDRDFFRILRAWATRKAGGNGTTAQFIALAERISGQQLDELFDAWLFTPGKPALGPASAAASAATGAARSAAGKGSAGRRRASPPPAPPAAR